MVLDLSTCMILDLEVLLKELFKPVNRLYLTNMRPGTVIPYIIFLVTMETLFSFPPCPSTFL